MITLRLLPLVMECGWPQNLPPLRVGQIWAQSTVGAERGGQADHTDKSA